VEDLIRNLQWYMKRRWLKKMGESDTKGAGAVLKERVFDEVEKDESKWS
jgi:hypothetical protein